MKEYGIQLYSVRDAMSQNVSTTLQSLADMGYGLVEFAGFFNHSAEALRQMLCQNGLVCSGTHSSFADLRPTKIMETIAYHKALGNPHYIVPGADLSTLEKIEDFCRVMNYAQPILAAEGIQLSYHNHSTEFSLMPWGSTIHSELEKRTSIGFEIDVYWAFNAGADPISLIDRLKNRVSVIHLKDGFTGGKGTPLGKGEVPLKQIITYAQSKGITMVVESETLTPSGLAEAKECIEYLKEFSCA